MSYIVWEWEVEPGWFVPYPSDVCCALENARSNFQPIVKLGDIDHSLQLFQVRIRDMEQTSAISSRTRKVKRSVIGSNHPLAKGPYPKLQQQSIPRPVLSAPPSVGTIGIGSGATALAPSHQLPSSSRSFRPVPLLANLPPSALSPELARLVRDSFTPCTTASSDPCTICLNETSEASDYDTAPLLPGFTCPLVSLKRCNHTLHNQCAYTAISQATSGAYFQCPQCQQYYGVRTGNQPTNGNMTVRVDSSRTVPGYENHGTIVVQYSFTPGVSENGTHFSVQGFPRIAYFPDNDKGNEVVDLLKEAFRRRLVFCIGTSASTGTPNCVVWNDIHHKTSLVPGASHGYPDPGYLDRILDELKAKGLS